MLAGSWNRVELALRGRMHGMPDDPRALLAAGPPTLGLHFKTIWKYFTCSF